MRQRVRRRWLGWPASGRACLVTIAAVALAAAAVASVGATRAGAQATGTSTTTEAATATATSIATTPITNLSPTIAPSPKLQLLSIHVSGRRVAVRLFCAFAACEVGGSLETIEHLGAGRATLLSAAGDGRSMRRIIVGGSSALRILPGKMGTLTFALNLMGGRLLESFRSLPASAHIVLTDGNPVTTIQARLELT